MAVKEGFRECTEQEVECFKLWYEFLKLTHRSIWSKDVKHYFGDLSSSFEQWWPEHKYLFEQEAPFTLYEITSSEQFSMECDIYDEPDWTPSVIGIFVNMFATKKDLRAAFEKLLTKHHQTSEGRPEYEGFAEHFNLSKNPDVIALKKILAVYQVYIADQKNPEQSQMKLWQIEEEVSKTIPLIDKKSRMATLIWTTKDVDATVIESRRRSQLTTVKKYLNYAEEILANVVNGKFPVYNTGKPKTHIESKLDVSDDDEEIIDEFGDNLSDEEKYMRSRE